MIHCLHIVPLALQVLSSMEKQFGIKSEEAAWIFSGKKLENLHSPPGPASCKSVKVAKPLGESDEKERFCCEYRHFLFVSSVRSSYSHPDLLLITTHFFRSHCSSTLDFHFLSHYSYIKAVMLYKGKTWQDSGILWNTLA